LNNNNKKEFSRLRKKLILYFILISVVSISVSAEIIFEFSSGRLKDEIRENLIVALSGSVSPAIVQKIDVDSLDSAVSMPLSTLRNRMILLLLVIFACIVGAFVLFTRDIVSPMDGIVDATKKIADGDLTVLVPVMSDDEIGQIARLINDMNVNLQDMVMQIRGEIERHKNKIREATDKIIFMGHVESAVEIIDNKRMKLSDFKKMIRLSGDVVKLLEQMLVDLSALETFVRMYKTYSIRPDIDQKEIDSAMNKYSDDNK
jgi:methyl-accepting chemotaxis protein